MIFSLIVTDTVREIVAPQLAPDAANGVVIADLVDGWTLAAGSESQRRRFSGGQEYVRLIGREFSYTTRLPGYELPDGWCICPSKLAQCHCRDSRGYDANGVMLTGGRRLTDEDLRERLAGDRYVDRLALGVQFDEHSWKEWKELAERWTRVQLCIRRDRTDRGTIDLWERAVTLRRRIAEVYGGPVAYGAVEQEDELLAFALADEDAIIPKGVVYVLHGLERVELRVVDVADGALRCEPSSGRLDHLRDYADRLRGDRRRLLLDPDATSVILDREEHTIRDFNRGLARNPNLEAQLLNPWTARLDETVEIDPTAIQENLDASQRDAVERAFRARDLLVVQGPPGTGKTTFIAELVLRHLREHPGDTVLVASQTNQATDNLLRRVHRLDPDLPLVRIASENTYRKIAAEARRFWLDAPEPWTPPVRRRAEHYGRFAHAQASVGARDAAATAAMLEIQREYLGTDGLQPTRERRLRDARLVAGTCFGVSADRDVRRGTYGLAILEEAGKASPTEALMPMLLAEKTVLVGDSRQLPPTPDAALDKVLRRAHGRPDAIADARLREEAIALFRDLGEARERLEEEDEQPEEYAPETLFTYLARRLRTEHPTLELTLRTQYRMATGIGDLISDCFYDGNLKNGHADERRDPRVLALGTRQRPLAPHVLFVDVAGVERRPPPGRGGNRRSFLNQREAQKVIPELLKLEDAAAAMPDADRAPLLDVAVLTAYRAQLRLLHETLDSLETPHLKVRIRIVDSFQGDEAEVVILSLVRTERPGFMKTRNRINVALSRARSMVIVLTSMPQARDGTLGEPLRRVVEYVDDRCERGSRMRDKRYDIDACRSGSRR